MSSSNFQNKYILISILSGLFFSYLLTPKQNFSWTTLFLSLYDLLPLFLTLLGGYTLYFLYNFLFAPLNYSVTAGNVQFPQVKEYLDSPGGKLTLSRTLGEFPPPYPNGWYVLMPQNELKKGQVVPMNVLGRQYVLWRDNAGSAHLFDAYCAHLGANLALGGVVKDNCLKCPFHGWEYDTEGNCARVPYASEPSKYAKVKSHTILEQDLLIYFWFDAEDRKPTWWPPAFKEINDKQYTYHGRTAHFVFAHLQELPENGADVTHLNQLHERINPWILHHWEGTWETLGNNSANTNGNGSTEHNKYPAGLHSTIYEPHLRKTSLSPSMDTSQLFHWSQLEIRESLFIFGRKISWLDVKVWVNQIGPGLVWLRFSTPLGQALVCSAATPYGPMLQKTIHTIYSEWSVPRVVAKNMLMTIARFYEQDVMVWQWKTFPSKPGLTKEDYTVKNYRKWFSQFYSENSVSFKEALDTHIKGQNAVISDW